MFCFVGYEFSESDQIYKVSAEMDEEERRMEVAKRRWQMLVDVSNLSQ